VHALRGIDLSVPRGTVLGVLGPNGAGKTHRGAHPDHAAAPGRRAGGGRGPRRGAGAAAVRRSIGLSGQSAAIQEELTGRENLEIIGRLYHLSWPHARSRAAELLKQFDLSDAADRAAKNFSGGMQRRLDLAASLVGQPQVLFLDEPTTGLDPRSRLGMWDIIRSLAAGGTTLLLTTQYLDEADELADEIVVIDHGLVIAAGTAEELKGRVGGDVVEFTVPDRRRSAMRSRRSPRSARASRTPTRRPACQRRGRGPRLGGADRGGARAWTARASRHAGSRCAGRRSTTCSWP
jgi:ABC-2 type transport system ATP-binding protein